MWSVSCRFLVRSSFQRQHPIGLLLPLSHRGAGPFPFLLSVSAQLKCSREILRNRFFAHMLSTQSCLLIFASSFVPGRACVCSRYAPLNFSVQFLFVSCLLNQNKPIDAVSSREQDLLPVLVICTNCSPEILISTGNSPLEQGTQRNTQLSLLQLSHLSIFWLDLCFAFLENFSPEHQMSLYFCASFHPVPCKNTLGELNRNCMQRVTSKVVVSPQNVNIGVCFYCG